MALDRVLSQEEIDNVFRTTGAGPGKEEKKAQLFDFRRPDRIGKEQLRSIHVLHETFARNLASSLSAYLRAYVSTNLVSVEQLSFMEFTQCLPSPTCIVSLSMKPHDGSAVLELNPALVFPILEMLLGGTGKSNLKIDREITEIEQSILEGLYRIILADLRASWAAVSGIQFAIDTNETEPQLLQILAPNEAVVAIAMEVRVGDNVGMMNIGIPSIVIKMLRSRFDQQWSVRRNQVTEAEKQKMLRLLMPAQMRLDARLEGPTLSVGDLLEVEEGDVLQFDFPVDKPLSMLVNNLKKYEGRIVQSRGHRAFQLQSLYSPDNA